MRHLCPLGRLSLTAHRVDDAHGLSHRFTREAVANGGDDLAGRWHDAEDHHRSAIDDHVAVDEHLVLTVAAVDRVDLDPELPSQPRRRTDGVNAGDSEGAIANGDSRHVSALPGVMAMLMITPAIAGRKHR